MCVNQAGWKDTGGYACYTYELNDWCLDTGEVGAGWGASWGTLEDFAVEGVSAGAACCACGGGSNTTGCEGSFRNWTDVEGQSCEDYEANQWCTTEGQPGPGWVASWGALADFGTQGRNAIEACCACGGGYAGTCQNRPFGWIDEDGDGCLEYEEDRLCTPYGEPGPGWLNGWGSLAVYISSNHSALTACCACGGGCFDNPSGWKDIAGADCATYATNNWCTTAGKGSGWDDQWGTIESFGTNGQNALTACCGCGGGSEAAATSQDELVCQDAMPEWKDSYGDSCKVYAAKRWCTEYGETGPGWPTKWGDLEDYAAEYGGENVSAYEACCACGAGCVDLVAGWVDSDGDGCDVYADKLLCTASGDYGIGWNMLWNTTFEETAMLNLTARDVCCVCGGGTPVAETLPPAPPKDLGFACVDTPRTGWVDARGYNCSHYSSQRWCLSTGAVGATWNTEERGPLEAQAGSMGSAFDACCGCGGGCADSPPGWVDTYGAGCETYEGNEWCTPEGAVGAGWGASWGSIEDFAVDGVSALAACCACGAGAPSKVVATVTTPTRTTTPLTGGANVSTTTGLVVPVTGTIELEVSNIDEFLADSEAQTEMEGFVAATFMQLLELPLDLIETSIVSNRRLTGAGLFSLRRLQAGTIKVEYKIHMPRGLDMAAASAKRSEIDALLKTIKKNEIQGLLSDIIAAKGGKYTVEVLSITVDDPPSDDTREVNATRMSSEEARTARADAVIIVVVVAICVLCCCGLCIAGRMLHKRHKAKKRAEARRSRGSERRSRGSERRTRKDSEAARGDDEEVTPALRGTARESRRSVAPTPSELPMDGEMFAAKSAVEEGSPVVPHAAGEVFGEDAQVYYDVDYAGHGGADVPEEGTASATPRDLRPTPSTRRSMRVSRVESVRF